MTSLLDVVRQSAMAASTVVPADGATLLVLVTFAGPVPVGAGPFEATGAGGSIPGGLTAALDGTTRRW